jgi:hypothetical protein
MVEARAYLLHDLFAQNTHWELEATDAVATPAGDGQWEVTFQGKVNKVAVDEEGRVSNLPVEDFVDLAVYANFPDGELGELLGRNRHYLTKQANALTIRVNQQPDLVAIDPDHLLIDRDRVDNFAPIRIAGPLRE